MRENKEKRNWTVGKEGKNGELDDECDIFTSHYYVI